MRQLRVAIDLDAAAFRDVDGSPVRSIGEVTEAANILRNAALLLEELGTLPVLAESAKLTGIDGSVVAMIGVADTNKG
jgi:hypothetical protein